MKACILSSALLFLTLESVGGGDQGVIRRPSGRSQRHVWLRTGEVMLTFHEKRQSLRLSGNENHLAPPEHRVVGLVSLSEQERQYLINVLHDEVMQLDCQILRLLQETLATGHVSTDIYVNTTEALHLMQRSIGYLRDITEKFSLPYIERERLIPAVQALLQHVEQQSNVCCSLIIEGDVYKQPLLEEQERVLYSIAQEAVMNVLQHAQASVLQITLSSNDNTFFLKIKDNGRGFVLQSPTELSKNRHLGLNLMRERVRQLRGTLNLDSISGKGTILAIQMPVNDDESENVNK